MSAALTENFFLIHEYLALSCISSCL